MSSLHKCYKCGDSVSEETLQVKDGQVFHKQCLEMVLCDHCGEEVPEKDREKPAYHKLCQSDGIKRCRQAVRAFKEFSAPGHVLFMAIHVHVLYGKLKEKSKEDEEKRKKKSEKDDEKKKKEKKEDEDRKKKKRKAILRKILNNVSALRNSNSGHLLIQLVGLSPDDTYIGPLDELIDRELNQLIADDQLFCDVFSKKRMSDKEEFKKFKEFIVLSVEASPTITTSDFKTKISLDQGLENPSPRVVFRFLQRKRKFKNAFPDITLKEREDIMAYHESRSVQMKSCSQNMIDESSNNGLVNQVFNERKLPEYVSAFTKIKDGGMFLVGVREEVKEYKKEMYVSKTVNPHGIKLNVAKVTKGIEERMIKEILACDYSGELIPVKEIFKVDTVPATGDAGDYYVLRVLVKPVNGLVFHDKDGPVAYRVDASDNPCIVKIETSDWFDIIQKKHTELYKNDEILYTRI